MSRHLRAIGFYLFVGAVVAAILLRDYRLPLLGGGFAVILVLLLIEQLSRRPRAAEPLRGNERLRIIASSRFFLVTTTWNGTDSRGIGEFRSDAIECEFAYRLEDGVNLIDTLSLASPYDGMVVDERHRIAVDSGFIAVLGESCAEHLFGGNRLKQAVMDLMQTDKRGRLERFRVLYIDNVAVGVVFIPSDGNGIFEYVVSRVNGGVARARFSFRSM